MIIIKLNEPQPLNCPKCKSKMGYQYSDLFRMSYSSFHNTSGKYEGGEYNTGVCLNRGVMVYCANCRAKLPFKLNRASLGDVS